MAWVVPAALTPWMAMHPALFRGWSRVLRAWGLAIFLFVVFMEVGTPSFIHQYDSRPNDLCVEYLQHYREVGGTLLAEHPFQPLAAAIGLPLLGWGFWRLNGPPSTTGPSSPGFATKDVVLKGPRTRRPSHGEPGPTPYATTGAEAARCRGRCAADSVRQRAGTSGRSW